MSKEELIEWNKLIAKFMDFPLTKKEIGFSGGREERIVDRIFLYHSSWDWLMPVVQKICDIDNCADEQLSEAIKFHDIELIYHTSILCPLEGVYQRVIQFIKFYNSYNQPNE